MLVATPGQTTAYNTLHNNSNGGGSNNTAAATTATKKSSALNSSNATASGTAKSLNNNNNHTTATVTTKNSLNSNSHTTTFNYHQNPKNDKIISNKLINHNKAAATTSKLIISSTMTAATTHSLKNENSTNTTNTTTTNKQQSFIQTLKDSVQKALISTTGSSSSNNSNANKYSTDNKLQIHCNNLTTSTQNLISSSSSTSHNANKISTTTSSNASSNLTTATQSSSSVSAVRNKYFTCSLSKLHTVAPTVIHRYPEERQDASSTDSLQKEMCHFKPIRIVPKTPWKSGSKSRGNCLRFPKANLATKKTEFVLKTNCDVNNRKKKQQQNRAQNNKINVDEDDDNEQENKEFHGIYKPKPSLTCLSTSITTPNHQSAFVCMIAQMKNLVNLQSKRLLQVAKTAGGGARLTSVEPLEELFVRKKTAKRQQKKVEELPIVRNTRLSSRPIKNKGLSSKESTETIRKERAKQTKAKSNNISSVSTVSITRAKSRRKLVGTKSKTIDMVALAVTKAKEKLQKSASMPAVASNKTKTIATGNKNARKRILVQEEDDIIDLDSPDLSPSSSTTKTTSIKSLVLGARKSSRLSSKSVTTNKLLNYSTNSNSSQQTINKSPQKPNKRTTSFICFSPPMTRSRHKHLTELGKIVTIDTLNIKKRKI